MPARAATPRPPAASRALPQQHPSRPALPPLGWACVLLLLISGLWAGCGGAGAAEQRLFALQCRIGAGPWQACAMEVEQVGQEWQLRIGRRLIRFRHEPRGPLRMQTEAGDWRPVDSRWQEPRDLCWDGVCARGDFPLD